ncbi:MAG: hypothetical protein COT17_05620 [Elusimicrobia bacterium CG08_land_8_20_14_0_20_51_18]|nr:MAG: hypothetical protein COT17_05620 [Elusimicrobia bacterium CG08_land_8_20_14_0_20_51_18]
MDLMSLASLGILAAIVPILVLRGEIPPIPFNLHALLLVVGGTAIAILLNTPQKYIKKSLEGLKLVFFEGEEVSPEKIIPYMVELADNSRKNGLKALKETDEKIAYGFLKRCCDAALEYGDSGFVKKTIEQEINQSFDEYSEISNVYRTMSILSPMFGLIGTLIGIIGVLKELSNPETVGPAMATAITSAFYGILLANLVFVPMAGKIRSRGIMQIKLKTMILEGILEIMKGSVPLVVERRLKSFNE